MQEQPFIATATKAIAPPSPGHQSNTKPFLNMNPGVKTIEKNCQKSHAVRDKIKAAPGHQKGSRNRPNLCLHKKHNFASFHVYNSYSQYKLNALDLSRSICLH